MPLELCVGERTGRGGGIGEFGTDGGKITGDAIWREGAGCFDGDVVAVGSKCLGEGMNVFCHQGFTACEDDVAECGAGGSLFDERFDGALLAVGVPRGVWGVAPAAAQVAAGGADEERWRAGEGALSLKGVECFSDVHPEAGAVVRY